MLQLTPVECDLLVSRNVIPHGAVLEQRKENVRVGEAEFIDWNVAKKRIQE